MKKRFTIATATFILCMFFSIDGVSQNRIIDKNMREIIRDSICYNSIVEEIELCKNYREGKINEKTFFSKKEELLRVRKERRATKNRERSSIATSDIGEGAETTMAINPNNQNQIVLAFIGESDVVVYYSNDAGGTWNLSNFNGGTIVSNAIPDLLSYDGGGDPTLTVDNNGVFYFAWIAFYSTTFNFRENTVYVTSTDGGMNFVPPSASDMVVSESYEITSTGPLGFLDRIWLAADVSGGPTDGTVYLNGTYVHGNGLGSGVYDGQTVFVKLPGATQFIRSSNQSLPVPLSPTSCCQYTNVVVDNFGIVHASGLVIDSATYVGKVVYSHSYDQGQTWSPQQQMGLTMFGCNMPDGCINIFGSEGSVPSLSVDDSTVYLAWTDLLDSQKVFYAISLNSGNTWSPPINVGSQIAPGPYFHTFINIAASNGNCSMVWFKTPDTDSAYTYNGEYIMAEIQNNGMSPIGYEVISSGIIPFSTGYGGWYGHYNVTRRIGCTSYSSWSDNSSGTMVVYVAKVDACGILTSSPEITPVNEGITINSIYPVPAENDINVDFSITENGKYSITIFDILGNQKIEVYKNANFSKGKNNFIANVSNLNAGTYLLNIVKENGVYLTRKFIVK